MNLRDRLQDGLTRACLCAGANADAFSLRAVRGGDGLTRVWWHDARTGHGRRLGRPLTPEEAQDVLPALFTQLRAWREARTPISTRTKVMAAGGLA